MAEGTRAGRAGSPGLAGVLRRRGAVRWSPAMPRLWALLVLRCLRLCWGKRLMSGGRQAQGGPAAGPGGVSCTRPSVGVLRGALEMGAPH